MQRTVFSFASNLPEISGMSYDILFSGLSHLGGLGLSKATFNPFGQNHFNELNKPAVIGPKLTPVIGSKVFSPSSSPVPPVVNPTQEKQLMPPSSFNPSWQNKSKCLKYLSIFV